MERITFSADEDLKERIDETANEEGITNSELVRRGVERYLEHGSLESRVNELEERVAGVEEKQNRRAVDRVLRLMP